MNKSRPKARLSRALGIPLTPKCVRYLENRPYPPGVHGRSRRTASDYKLRLLEKQRLRYQYNVSEKQLRLAVDGATRASTKTGDALLVRLETRLDAVVLRSGFARTIYQARQFVSHRHLLVNGRRVDKPSFRVSPGDIVSVAPASRRRDPFVVAAAGAHATTTPGYLTVDLGSLEARLLRQPERHEIPVVCAEQLVVEYYAR